eukprot:5323615-Amphidinium_carterae.1
MLSSASERPATTQGQAQRCARTPDTQLHWVTAHQTQQAVIDGCVTMEDFRGNQEADTLTCPSRTVR